MNEYGDWKEQTSSAGKTYYYNVRTESSQWDKPKEWLDYERRRSKYLSDKYYREKYEASYEKYATNYPKSYSYSNDARPGQTHNNNKDYPSRHKDYGNKDYKEYSSKEYKEYKEYKDGYKEYKDSYKDSYNPSVRHHRSPSYSSRRRDTDKRYDEEAKSRSFYDEDGKSRSFYRRSFEDDKRFYNDEDNSNSNSNNSNSNNNNTTTNTTTTNNKRFYRRSDEDERRLSSERSVKRPRSERFYGKKSDTPGSPLKPTDSQCNIMNNSFNPRHMDSDTKKRDMKLSSNSDSINYHPQSLANSNQQNSHSHSNSHTNSHSHSSSAMNQSGNVSGNVSYQMKEDQLSALMSLLSPEQKKILLQQLKHHGINLNTNNYDEVQAFLKSFAAKLNPSMLVSVTNMNGSSNSSFNNSNNANNSNSNGNNNVINNNASKPAQSKSSLHHQQPQQQQQQQHSSSSLSPNDVSPDQNHSVCNNVNVVKQNSLARNGLNYRNNADGIRQDLDQMSKNMIQSPTSTAAAANANVNVSANSMANAINANASGLANSLANDCATGKSLLLHRSDSNSLAANSISSAIGNVTSQNKNAMSSLNRFKHLFREDLIQHITNWPSDQLEEQAWLHFEQVAQLGNRLGKVSVELKKARSKVRLNEVEITLHKQRIQFANQQIKQLEEDQVSFA